MDKDGTPATLASRWGHSASPPARCSPLDASGYLWFSFLLWNLISPFSLPFHGCQKLLCVAVQYFSFPFFITTQLTSQILECLLCAWHRSRPCQCRIKAHRVSVFWMVTFRNVRQYFLNINAHENPLRILWKCWFWFRKSGWSQRSCGSNQLLGDASAAHPRPILCIARMQSTSILPPPLSDWLTVFIYITEFTDTDLTFPVRLSAMSCDPDLGQ